MFFRNIKSWSKKKMWIATIVCYLIYSGLLVLAPMITIMIKYDVFNNTGSTRKINGFGLVVVCVFGVYAIIMLKKLIAKLPSVSITEQRFKFGVETVINLIPFALVIYFLFIAKDNVNLAFSTAKWLILWGTLATAFNGLIIKFIDAEWFIRSGSKLDKAKKEREGVV